MKLTVKQEAFANHYALHGVAVEAYKAAGYSWKRMKKETLGVKAAELVAHGSVSVRIAELQQRKAERAEHVFDITADRILQELAAIGFANMQDFTQVDARGQPHINLADLGRHQWAAIGSVKTRTYPERCMDGEFEEVKETEFKLLDKKGALVELGKHIGMFKEQHKHDHTHNFVDNAASDFDSRIAEVLARGTSEASSHLVN